MVKIIRVEHIQDGIERIEFAAGIAAIYYMQHLEGIVTSSAAVLSVQEENLPSSVARFFGEWKEQKKDIERLSQKLVELEIRTLVAEPVGGIPVVVKKINLPPKELALLAASVSEKGGVALMAGCGESVRVVLASGDNRVNAGEIIGQVCGMLGGKGGGKPSMAQGGGPDAAQLDLALKVGRERIIAALKA
jgi:alanyl-tRNA synthetase